MLTECDFKVVFECGKKYIVSLEWETREGYEKPVD